MVPWPRCPEIYFSRSWDEYLCSFELTVDDCRREARFVEPLVDAKQHQQQNEDERAQMLRRRPPAMLSRVLLFHKNKNFVPIRDGSARSAKVNCSRCSHALGHARDPARIRDAATFLINQAAAGRETAAQIKQSGRQDYSWDQ